MKYQTRADWNAKPPKWKETIKTSKGTFIHYNGPAVNNAVLAGDYNAVKTFLQGIQNYHMNTNGWPDIAYSWSCDSMGRIWELRGWAVAGAHTLNHNWDSHAIFLPLGGNQAPTNAQITACKTVIAEHNRRFGAGFVKGHQDAPNQTSCPGPIILPMVREGKFNPTNPAPNMPIPQGVNIMTNKPVMMQEPDGTVWMYYEGTPWRVHIKTPADVAAFKYMGVTYKTVDKNQAAFFRRYSQEIKCA
jgi:N-acetylmuramoyl-L-alanine amidase